MKKILIMAGGTATAWHIVQTIKEYFYSEYEIHICDINPPELVAASKYAHKYHRVPLISDPFYIEHMYGLLQTEKIDIVLPLIDFDLQIFALDEPKLKDLGVKSTAPEIESFLKLTDKRELNNSLKDLNIPHLLIYDRNDIDVKHKYVLKPAMGFGSRGFRIVEGSQIDDHIADGDIIQELCVMDLDTHEITAEVYNHKKSIRIFLRERIETKQGVCTKMKITTNSEIENYIRKLVNNINLPTAFCAQFMLHKEVWCLTDCNLRLGAGTALASKVGFQLARALLATFLDGNAHDECLNVDCSAKAVVRVYDEVVMR